MKYASPLASRISHGDSQLTRTTPQPLTPLGGGELHALLPPLLQTSPLAPQTHQARTENGGLWRGRSWCWIQHRIWMILSIKSCKIYIFFKIIFLTILQLLYPIGDWWISDLGNIQIEHPHPPINLWDVGMCGSIRCEEGNSEPSTGWYCQRSRIIS